MYLCHCIDAGQGRWPNIVDSANPTSYIAQKLSVLGISSVLLSPAVPLLFYGQEFLDHQNFVFGNVPNLDWSQVGNFSNGVWTSLGPFNGIFNLTRDLISLRLNKAGYSAALQTVNINVYYQSQSDLVIAFTRGQDQSVVVVMNLRYETETPAPHPGACNCLAHPLLLLPLPRVQCQTLPRGLLRRVPGGWHLADPHQHRPRKLLECVRQRRRRHYVVACDQPATARLQLPHQRAARSLLDRGAIAVNDARGCRRHHKYRTNRFR